MAETNILGKKNFAEEFFTERKKAKPYKEKDKYYVAEFNKLPKAKKKKKKLSEMSWEEAEKW